MGPERYTVQERGKLSNPDNLYLTPHDLAFPSAMSTLMAFMGFPLTTRTSQGHGVTWLNIVDHYCFVGLSGEGFSLLYNLPDGLLRDNVFGATPLKDCFAYIGLPCELYGVATLPARDRTLSDSRDFVEVVTGQAERNLPAIVLAGKGRLYLVAGYRNRGETLRAWVFEDGAADTNAAFQDDLCQYIDNWTESATGIITIGEPCERENRRTVFLRGLQRGYEMITASDRAGFGRRTFTDWAEAVSTDGNYLGDLSSTRPYIDPYMWDLAERRAWAANFLRAGEPLFGNKEALAAAIACFDAIHDQMWRINALCRGADAVKLRESATRWEIAKIIRESANLDLQAASHIKSVLDDETGW
jgi:hypothetical protein